MNEFCNACGRMQCQCAELVDRFDKARLKERINKAIKLMQAVEDWNPCGGGLHIVVSDGNLDDDSLKFCRDREDLTDTESECLKHLENMDYADRLFAWHTMEGDHWYDLCCLHAELESELEHAKKVQRVLADAVMCYEANTSVQYWLEWAEAEAKGQPGETP